MLLYHIFIIYLTKTKQILTLPLKSFIISDFVKT